MGSKPAFRRTRASTIITTIGFMVFVTMFALFVGESHFSSARLSISRDNFVADTGALPCSVNDRRLLDEEPIHILMALCVRHTMAAEDEGLTTMRSILAARDIGPSSNRRYVFHLVLNKWSAWLVNYNTTISVPHGTTLAVDFIKTFHEIWGDVLAYIDTSSGRVVLKTYSLEDFDAAVDAELGVGSSNAISSDGFKTCSPLRLKAPFALSSTEGLPVDRVIYIDLDTIVQCDIEMLWNTFDSWTERQWFSVAPNLYRPENEPIVQPNGVLLMKIGRIRMHLREYWEEVARIVVENGYKSPRFNVTKMPYNVEIHPQGMLYYDQDILGIMSFDWPDRFRSLDVRYNWFRNSIDSQRMGIRGSSPVCIEHFAGGQYSGYLDKKHAGLFAYWHDSRRIATDEQKRMRIIRKSEPALLLSPHV